MSHKCVCYTAREAVTWPVQFLVGPDFRCGAPHQAFATWANCQHEGGLGQFQTGRNSPKPMTTTETLGHRTLPY